jgi:hypothetical protein
METVVRGKYAQETAQYQRSAFDAVLQPLKEHGLTSVSVARTMARLIGRGYTAPFSVTAERHPTDAGRWPILLRFAQDAMPQLALENVTALFASGLGLSVQAAAAKARTYLELDAAIRLHAPSQSQSFLQYVGSQTYNQDINNSGRTLEQLSAGNIDLNVFFEELGVHKPHQLWPVWVSSPAYFRWLWGTSGPFRGSADSIRTFVEFSMVYHMHAFVPDFGEGHNSFRRRGQQKKEDELCLKLTAEMVPAFVAERFARTRPEMEQLRVKVSSMLQQIVAQLRLLVDTTTWLSEDERRVATDKLDGLVVRVAHPNNKDWFDGESIGRELRPDQYIQNVDRVRAYRVQRNLKLWEQYGQILPLNGHSMSGLEDMNIRDQIARFGVPLSMVNAFYDPTTNTITVPLGILQYPFCDLRFDEASMYASIGSVLGHELAHAFDSTGILFDVHGSYRSGG